MWDSMIEKVKVAIYRYERKLEDEESQFYSIVYGILVDRWTKNCTPLHCLAHSLNPRYYSNEWLKEDKKRIPPYKDVELVQERNNCLKRYFPNVEERRLVNLEYAAFSGALGPFAESDFLCDRAVMDAKSWWLIYGVHAPTLLTIALKLFGHPNSFSSCERNWSTYSFIHSLKRNNLAPQRAEDLVFVHTNLRLLSRRKPQYQEGFTKMWDIAGDSFDSFNDIGILELANLSLDEPELEKFMLTDEDHEDEDVDAVEMISH